MSPTELVVTSLLVLIFVISAKGEESTKFKDETCWKNKSQPITAENNYQICDTKKNIKENLTRCCKIGASWGCCKSKESSSGRMLTIAMGIVGVALFLGTIVFVLNWCDVETFPCLAKCEDRFHVMEKIDKFKRRGEPDVRVKSTKKYETQEDEDDDNYANVNISAPPEFKQAKANEAQNDFWF